MNTTIIKATSALECNISSFINPMRISGLDKRDILLLWNTGLYRNYEIAKMFNISYSSVSKQVSNIKLNLRKESQIKKIFEKANSLFNRLSENANPVKLYIDSKGLMTRKFAKMPILGQPVKR